MATISSMLDGIVRVSLSDQIKSRWSDNDLLSFVRVAIRRINNIAIDRELSFVRKKAELVYFAGEREKALPADFQSPISLRLQGATDFLSQLEPYQITGSDDANSAYAVDGDKLAVQEAQETTKYELRYNSRIAYTDITLSSQTPWGGKVDEIIADYVIFRAKNADSYNTQADISALKEIENSLLDIFVKVQPTVKRSSGWL